MDDETRTAFSRLENETRAGFARVEHWFELSQAQHLELRHDVSGLQRDVSGLKQDVSGLKQDVSGLKQDVSGLKKDISDLRQDVAGLRAEFHSFRDWVVAEFAIIRAALARLTTRIERMEGGRVD